MTFSVLKIKKKFPVFSDQDQIRNQIPLELADNSLVEFI